MLVYRKDLLPLQKALLAFSLSCHILGGISGISTFGIVSK